MDAAVSSTRTARIDALQYSVWERARFREWRDGGLDCVHVTLATWETARETLSILGEWVRHFRDNSDLIRPALSGADIRAAKEEGRTAVILGFQNASPFEDDLDLVGAFHAAGVRIVQLTYNIQNHIGSGCWEENDGGLSGHFGRNVIHEMNSVGMLVDLSHCGERTCRDAIEVSTKPVAITHGNPFEFVGPDVELARRNRSTDVLRALAEKGGVVGLSMYPRLAPGGDDCTLEMFCEMVGWTAETLGIDHVGIGTDLYLGHDEESLAWWRMGRWSRDAVMPLSGVPSFPEWMSSPTQFLNLDEGLATHGFDAAERDAVLGGNWERLFTEVFGDAESGPHRMHQGSGKIGPYSRVDATRGPQG